MQCIIIFILFLLSGFLFTEEMEGYILFLGISLVVFPFYCIAYFWLQELIKDYKDDMFSWMAGRFFQTDQHDRGFLQKPKVEIADMVIIRFRNVSHYGRFRYHKKWWTKINFKDALPDNGNTVEFDCENFVGVPINSLTDTQRHYIVKL